MRTNALFCHYKIYVWKSTLIIIITVFIFYKGPNCQRIQGAEKERRGKKNKDKEQLDRTLDNKNRKENVSVTLPYLEAFRLNCL